MHARPRCHATNACAAYAGSSAAPARRSGPAAAAIRRLWRWSEAASPLFAHCIDAMQKPAAEPGTAACIYTYIRLLDGCPALCALYRKAAPSGEFIHIRHGRLSGRQIYIDMVLYIFLNEEFRGGRTSFPDLTTPFVYVKK